MRDFALTKCNDEVPLIKTYEVKKQRVEVLSINRHKQEVFMKR